eukprot:TRINITY_DN9636_c0_g1_i1.p1 TRINITY_DN9636_c0_g1~~TRINITY_DN9636_c0_g1_i1.p1  ORF type:complete len:312 (-),score=74.34 TRINITY_DN9636_c0_g1_i1:318-1253(-)
MRPRPPFEERPSFTSIKPAVPSPGHPEGAVVVAEEGKSEMEKAIRPPQQEEVVKSPSSQENQQPSVTENLDAKELEQNWLAEKMARQDDKKAHEVEMNKVIKALEGEKMHRQELEVECTKLRGIVKNFHSDEPTSSILSDRVPNGDKPSKFASTSSLPPRLGMGTGIGGPDFDDVKSEASSAVETHLEEIRSLVLTTNSAVRELQQQRQQLERRNVKGSVRRDESPIPSGDVNVYFTCSRFFLVSFFGLFISMIAAALFHPQLNERFPESGLFGETSPISIDQIFQFLDIDTLMETVANVASGLVARPPVT